MIASIQQFMMQQTSAIDQTLQGTHLTRLMGELHMPHVVTIGTDKTHHALIDEAFGDALTRWSVLPG